MAVEYKDALEYAMRAAPGAVLCDEQIRRYVGISPMAGTSPPGKISYGLTSYGYDMRIDRRYKLFCGDSSDVKELGRRFGDFGLNVIDPKNFIGTVCTDFEGDELIMPPHSFALGVSVERFKIPRNVLAICVGKSTYARCGIILNVTPLEPEWEGRVTIEISNTTPNSARIYSNEGIAQVVFLKGLSDCVMSYADKKGRYQGQTDITLPFVK